MSTCSRRQGLNLHQLRHTLAPELYEETGDALIVTEALGHANSGMTQIYTKVRPARLEEALRKLNFAEGVSDQAER